MGIINAQLNVITAKSRFQPGSYVWFGQPNQIPDPDNPATLKIPYLDPDLTQPASAIQGLDSDSKFQQTITGFLYGSGRYSVRVMTAADNTGTQLYYIPEVVVTSTIDEVRRNHVAQVATIADLRALEPAFDGQQVSVSSYHDMPAPLRSVGGGVFTAKFGDYSTEVATDTLTGVYVAFPSGPTGASGAWVRKLDGYLTPEMFGSDGTELRDTPAMQAAVNFGSVKSVVIDRDINVDNSPSPVNIVLDGVTISGKGSVTFSTHEKSGFYVTGSDCRISDITVVGPGTVDTSFPTGTGLLNAFLPGLIAVVGVTTVDSPKKINAKIYNVNVKNPGTVGITIYKCIGAEVRGCCVTSDYPLTSLINQPQFFGVNIYTSAQVSVLDNTIVGFSEGICAGAIGGGYSFDDHLGETSSKTRHFLLSGNRVTRTADHSIYVSNDCEKYDVAGNHLWAATYAEVGGSGGQASLKLEGGYFTATGNTCRDGIWLRNCHNCVIDGNFVPVYTGTAGLNSSTSGITHIEAVFNRDPENITVSNNVVKVVGGVNVTAGLLFEAHVVSGQQTVFRNLTITGNTFDGFGKDAVTGYGILVRQSMLSSGGIIAGDPATGINISNNTIVMADDITTPETIGLRLEYSIDGAVICGNTIRNAKDKGVHFLGVKNAIVSGNNIEFRSGAAYGAAFEERLDDSLVYHAVNEFNTYGVNHVKNAYIKYYLAKTTSVVKDQGGLKNLADEIAPQIAAVSAASVYLWEVPNAGSRTIELLPGTWFNGQEVTIKNTGLNDGTILHPNGSTTTNLPVGGAVSLFYNGSDSSFAQI